MENEKPVGRETRRDSAGKATEEEDEEMSEREEEENECEG